MDRSSVAQILGAPHTRFAVDPYEYFMYELTNKTTVREGATCAMYGFLTGGLSWINCPDEDTYFVRFEVSKSTAASEMFLGK